ncbi:MAG: hypothetical protein LBC28_02890 [Oscillospiraceae bacterium]|jgi:hypothetical protein|nr:hypothetical protein [Oscillospiraceae bacterium]
MVYEYWKLIDAEHCGVLVRTSGEYHERFYPGSGWTRSGILIKYFSDESDYYELYEKITEAEALALIDKQNAVSAITA